MDRFAMSAGGDFRRFNIFPTSADLTGNRDPLLSKNRVEGSYKDTDDYLNVQIRLLREDFLDPWRQTLNGVRNGHWEGSADEVEIFGVRFVPEPRSRNRSQRSVNDRIQIQFDPRHLKELGRSESKRFQYGSLVCLSSDRFKTLVVATIAGNRELKDGTLCLSVGSNRRVKDELHFGCEYELIENTKICFQTYPLFLKVLQEMDTLPFQEYLLNPKGQEIPPPKYLLTNEDGQHVQFSFSSLLKFEHQIPIRETAPVLNLDLWPGPDELDLDRSQYDALRTAVTKEFAIIQGPPGTGKTFIGVKIVQLFLENNWGLGKRSVSDDNDQSSRILFARPIILLAHTNHALDQFLEAIIEIYPEETYEENRSIFRIGGRSKSTNENLKRCILDTIDFESYKELQNAKIVAMTTSGAAKYKAFISSLQSKLVIVEEAAEILESHLVASIPKTCEHLILIGDHQQLRPRPASYWLETEYELGVSLFERLVKNNLPSVCLTTQRRMRPEIAELLTPHIYKSLKNHESVKEYEDVAGIFGNLLFIDHYEEEGAKDDDRSYSNVHEATFLVELCDYLLGVGYKPCQITILVTYASQDKKIRSLCSGKLSEVRITTVDNYQGEENDIILLSLVRSNQRNSIGFLKCPNRVCVALSRARKGLYIIGNGDLLRSVSDLWEKILESVENQGTLVSSLRLGCHRHPGKDFHVACASDFENVPKSGCSEPCRFKLPLCGHRCKMKCHQLHHDHNECRCKERRSDNVTKYRGNKMNERHTARRSSREPTGRYQDYKQNQQISTDTWDNDSREYSGNNAGSKRERTDRISEKRCQSRSRFRNERDSPHFRRCNETSATKRSHRQTEHLTLERDFDWSPDNKRRRGEESTVWEHSQLQDEIADWKEHGHSRHPQDPGTYERASHERRVSPRRYSDVERRRHRTPPIQNRVRQSEFSQSYHSSNVTPSYDRTSYRQVDQYETHSGGDLRWRSHGYEHTRNRHHDRRSQRDEERSERNMHTWNGDFAGTDTDRSTQSNKPPDLRVVLNALRANHL